MQYKIIEYVSNLLQKGTDYASKAKVAARDAAIVGLAALVLSTAGCSTINGIMRDVEEGSGAAARWTQGYVDAQSEQRLRNAEKERQEKIDEAAEVVLKNRSQQ